MASYFVKHRNMVTFTFTLLIFPVSELFSFTPCTVTFYNKPVNSRSVKAVYLGQLVNYRIAPSDGPVDTRIPDIET
jgi:hypothetical protein